MYDLIITILTAIWNILTDSAKAAKESKHVDTIKDSAKEAWTAKDSHIAHGRKATSAVGSWAKSFPLSLSLTIKEEGK